MHFRFISLVLALACPSTAFARQCLPGTTQEQFATADWVFVGEVVERTPAAARLQIGRTLKGPPDREASILLEEYSPLAVPAVDGRAVLVFARRHDDTWSAGMCSGTGVVQRQDERLVALGFGEHDFEVLGLPTDTALMRRLVAEWEVYREAVLACPDAACYQRLQGDAGTVPATVAYYVREFPRERALYAALAAPASHELAGGGVGESTAYLRYVLKHPYQPPHEAAYDGFEVDFRRIDQDHWAVRGAWPRVMSQLVPVRDRHRAWSEAQR
jgi:hypothetical protein